MHPVPSTRKIAERPRKPCVRARWPAQGPIACGKYDSRTLSTGSIRLRVQVSGSSIGYVERPLTGPDLRTSDLTRAQSLDMVGRLSQLPAALTSGGMASRTTALATREIYVLQSAKFATFSKRQVFDSWKPMTSVMVFHSSHITITDSGDAAETPPPMVMIEKRKSCCLMRATAIDGLVRLADHQRDIGSDAIWQSLAVSRQLRVRIKLGCQCVGGLA